MDPKAALIVAGVFVVPGLWFMWDRHLFGEPLAWMTVVGMAAGFVLFMVAEQVKERGTRTTVQWVAAILFFGGIVADVILFPEMDY